MHQAISEMMKPYNCQTASDYKNALKEIIQQITLLGLSRQGFFNKAAFYGGTALRIGHGLNRFSEDMDFTLLYPDTDFSLEKYLKGIVVELKAYELDFSAQKIEKNRKTPIESAFIKGNTLSILISITEKRLTASGTHKNELLKIKLEIDTLPPAPAGMSETLFLTNPIPFSYRILKLESLFSGKLHAILCRDYPSGRVKGRDFYDLIWYVNKKISPDLLYLEAKLKQSGHFDKKMTLTKEIMRIMVQEKILKVDFDDAKKDVAPFIKDPFELDLWSVDFFTSLLQTMA
ncbi:nucleotidyl transferase AbiEii/AbiGii toxin family protein [Oceanispirochaeta sp.]|jgi:predicted nucleotidyltransferase component of viral defense system|uniref:nucleotidyl transferase AbiEii/AbiGii toxin family protein n=1 Tax=Oceanispirochaeta sp. TaxID=2035350 RepID=UPI00260D0C15|nr:nucleotidyl transferase AbiEii/AbiGii toxin family protein [Oceanispirochaeta sp.]MDA3957802.1 nucleotidyl transferase AbiEii/AbiGii toxin family protein [Oceanispirochaeta sp.]